MIRDDTSLVLFSDAAIAEKLEADTANPVYRSAAACSRIWRTRINLSAAIQAAAVSNGRFIIEVEYIGNILRTVH